MKRSNTLILAVDDKEDMCQFISLALQGLGKVISAYNGEEALKKIADLDIDVIISDIDMPRLDGAKLLEILKQEQKVTIPVIMITGVGIHGLNPVQSAVHCMKMGAFDYLDKQDISLEKLQDLVKRALESRELLKNVTGSQELDIPGPKGSSKKIIGVSKQLKEVFQNVMKLANTTVNVLISGETGTGKEMVAQAIHYAGQRRSGPFVPINCAAIPKELLESELFGHERGSFTGAFRSKRGRFELANGGTFFLDEVSEMSLDIQVKLLRVLQERVIERVGGLKFIPIDVRIIAATNQDLEKAVKEGTFRQDLYYRLNVVPIYIPPLRERKDDIPPLVDYILSRESEAQCVTEKISFSPQSMEVIQNHDWPGNVREVENVIARSVALRTGPVIQVENLNLPQSNLDFRVYLEDTSLKDAAQRAECARILEVLQKTNWNKTQAAKILGISDRTLRYKLKNYNIS
jgi:two-component system response regulator AtoC